MGGNRAAASESTVLFVCSLSRSPRTPPEPSLEDLPRSLLLFGVALVHEAFLEEPLLRRVDRGPRDKSALSCLAGAGRRRAMRNRRAKRASASGRRVMSDEYEEEWKRKDEGRTVGGVR